MVLRLGTTPSEVITPSLQASLASTGSHELYVDKYRTDIYTEDGSELHPCKSITAALNYIKGVAVAGQDWAVMIRTGQYQENLVLEDPGLHMISLVGTGGVVGIVPAAGNALQSTADNDNLVKLRMYNLEFTQPVVITGQNGAASFADVWMDDCKFVGAATITLNCINNWSMMTPYIETAISLTNVNWFYVDSGRLNGTFVMVCDDGLPAPSGGANGTAFLNGVYEMGNVTLTKGGAAAGTFVVMGGSRINGSTNTVTVPAGWIFQAYCSFIRGNLTNNGTFQQRGSFVEKVFTNAGTWTNDTKAGMLGYTPAAAADWVDPDPITVQAAIDRIAAVVAANHGAIP